MSIPRSFANVELNAGDAAAAVPDLPTGEGWRSPEGIEI